MPRRITADQKLILAVYKETGVIAETARRTGYHYQTVIQAIRRSEAKCVRCGQPVQLGKQYCTKCLAEISANMKAKRKERLRKGLCVKCDKPYELPSRLYCAEHRQATLEANQAYHERRKEVWGSSQGRAATPSRRLYNVRANYGEAGVAVWQRLDGRCILCNVGHQDRSVNIHHIDGDHSRSAEDNLTCLCYRCHKLVHLLTEHPNPQFALEWIRSTYWS